MFKLKRYEKNPVLEPDKKLAWEKEGVFNPGITKLGEEIYMLYRAVGEREAYISRLGLAKSKDGLKFERLSDKPVFEPREIFDKWGTEDPRITQIGDDFYITYVALPERFMQDGRPIERPIPLETLTALLKTKDFITYENLGVISPPNSDNKDIVLFPKKINGRYFMLHRPLRWSQEWFKGPHEKYVDEGLPCDVKDLPVNPGIWTASSLNLKNWGRHNLLIRPTHQLDHKVGPGLPPIETPSGWLLIYHHVRQEGIRKDKFVYTARVALLDLNDPTRVIAKLPYDILLSEEPYETENDTAIVFPTGGFISGNDLYVYYGASDRYVCLATGSLSELLAELRKFSKQ